MMSEQRKKKLRFAPFYNTFFSPHSKFNNNFRLYLFVLMWENFIKEIKLFLYYLQQNRKECFSFFVLKHKELFMQKRCTHSNYLGEF